MYGTKYNMFRLHLQSKYRTMELIIFIWIKCSLKCFIIHNIHQSSIYKSISHLLQSIHRKCSKFSNSILCIWCIPCICELCVFRASTFWYNLCAMRCLCTDVYVRTRTRACMRESVRARACVRFVVCAVSMNALICGVYEIYSGTWPP